ncbi:nitroreductase [Mycolicibacterium sp. XJ2546]
MESLRNGVRTFNKHVLNPMMLRVAGRKHWYAAVIWHTGRRSGKRYATPVVAARVPEGFIVPLPYGTNVDWLRNVLAAGRAVITESGETYDVVEPTVTDAASAISPLSARRRETWRRFGIERFLKVKIVS